MTTENAAARTALVISAHAADFVWRCGGAIALHAALGYKVTVVCLSFGERGESAMLWKDKGMTLNRVKAARRDGHARVLLGADDLALPAASQSHEGDRKGQRVTERAFTAETLPEGGLREAIDAYQRRLIADALDISQGNWTQTAQRLGLDRANLRRLARRLGLEGGSD